MKSSFWITAGLACTLLSAWMGTAQAQVLYDGAGNKTPDQSPYAWVFGQTPLFSPNLHGAASGGATVLDTTASNAYAAGYNYFAPFTLDNTNGYIINFDLQVNSETHNGADKNNDGIADRAGVSVIVLGSDHKGVELAFWQDEVWTQSDSFLHATSGTETTSFDTQSGKVHYALDVANGAYTLTGNGASLLSGSLHSYAAGPSIPYNFTNYLFIGDDTASARANVSLFHVEVTPEPGASAGLAALLVSGIGWTWRSRQRAFRMCKN